MLSYLVVTKQYLFWSGAQERTKDDQPVPLTINLSCFTRHFLNLNSLTSQDVNMEYFRFVPPTIVASLAVVSALPGKIVNSNVSRLLTSLSQPPRAPQPPTAGSSPLGYSKYPRLTLTRACRMGWQLEG